MLSNIPKLGVYESLIIFIVLILSVSIHEFSHALIAYIRGDDTAKYNGRLTLNPFAHFEILGFLMMLFTNFGWGKPVPINSNNMKNPRTDSLLVAIAGPISNLLTAVLAAIIARGVILLRINELYLVNILFILSVFILINVGLAIFNLLPIPPLDGSSIYRSFLPYRLQYQLSMLSGPAIIILLVLAFVPIFNNQSIISAILSPIIYSISAFLTP